MIIAYKPSILGYPHFRKPLNASSPQNIRKGLYPQNMALYATVAPLNRILEFPLTISLN